MQDVRARRQVLCCVVRAFDVPGENVNGRWLGAVLVCAVGAGSRMVAQAPADAALQKELTKLGAMAESLDHSLPSFTCKEDGTSELHEGRKVREHVSFSAVLRARRDDAGKINETFVLTELNGKPYTGRYNFPLFVTGGFDNSMRYFAPKQQACYAYALLPGRIDFATSPEVKQHPECRDEGMAGYALLDAEGNVTHLQRTVSAEASNIMRVAPFTAIDFQPVELNGETFRLSKHMIAEHPYERLSTHFEVTYSECKLFHVTVTLGPATVVPEPPAGKDAPK
jgi:hypothetical protein